ncbi:MAG: L,D-transpeptidase [Methylocystis sp.]|uniref:L,D-transpeptidase n=1 Tax=Methylocystis sp. TaxID=1911079 RepID=UPI003DA2B2E1
MNITRSFPAILLAAFGLNQPASARVHIHVDLATQTMYVSSAEGSYTWPVSTARAGYVTPRGNFSATGLQRMHYSRKYDMSPMPHSIFFHGGYAIHGSYATGSLGRPASHGCVRLAPGNAATLYHMVQAEGASISITGSRPGHTGHYASSKYLFHTSYTPRRERYLDPFSALFGD